MGELKGGGKTIQHGEQASPGRRTWLKPISLAAVLAAAFSLWFIYPWLVNDPEVESLPFGPTAPPWVFVIESVLFLLLGFFAWIRHRYALHSAVLIVALKAIIFLASLLQVPGFVLVLPDVVAAIWVVLWVLLIKHLYELVRTGDLS
ncbi:MAG: hypothetical protein R3D56_12065 [Paracoccaceae bacterium]